MKLQLTILIGIMFFGFDFGTTGYAQGGSQVDGNMTVKTHADADKIAADGGGKVYLSSVAISGSQIKGSGLDMTTTTTAGTVAVGENAQINLASLLLNSSAVDGVPNAIELETRVGDVTANENARVDISSISMSGGTISGNLAINDGLHTKAGNITTGKNSTVAVASLLMANTTTGNVTIDKLSANIGDLTVGDNVKAYVSSLKLDGVTVGEVAFRADTHLNGHVTVSEGEILNVNSVVLEDVTVSGGMELDLQSAIQNGVTVDGDGAEVMIGGVRVGGGPLENHNEKMPSKPIINANEQPEYLPGISQDGGIAYAAYMLAMSEEERNAYQQQYDLALNLYSQMEIYKQKANRALADGNIAEYEKYKALFYKSLRDYSDATATLHEMHDGNFEQPIAVAKKVYEYAKYSTKILAAATGNPVLKKVVDATILGLDYMVDSSELGSNEAKKKLVASLIEEAIFNAPIVEGKSISDVIEEVTGPTVGQSGAYEAISDVIDNQETREQIMRGLHYAMKDKLKDEGMDFISDTIVDKVAENVVNEIEHLADRLSTSGYYVGEAYGGGGGKSW